MPPKNIQLLVKKAKIIQVTLQEPTRSIIKKITPATIIKRDDPESSDPDDDISGEMHTTIACTLNEKIPENYGNVALQKSDNKDDTYVSLSTDEKEHLIDNLETKKYELKKRYKEGDGTVKTQLKEICRLLGNVKQCDVDEKVDVNIKNKLAIETDFKKREEKLKLSLSDFRKIINLMAPKEDREPDITTEQWRSSKELFKGKTYRDATQEKKDKFTDKLKPKKMSDHIKRDMIKRVEGNIKNIHIHANKQDILKYQQYDPLNFNGLHIY